MTQLSARTRALLERARAEANPSAEDIVHLHARLAASLAKQAPDPVLLPFSLGKLGGALLVAAVALGAWHLRGELAERDRRQAEAKLPNEHSVAEPLSCPPVPSCDSPPPQTPIARAVKERECPNVPAQTSSGAEDIIARSRRGEMNDSLFSAESARKNPEAMELELLILARVALDEDRPIDALGHVLRHKELFPQSAFEEERLAVEVLAYCPVGHRDLALERFEQLLRLSPETTYLPRVRDTCGEEFVSSIERRGAEHE